MQRNKIRFQNWLAKQQQQNGANRCVFHEFKTYFLHQLASWSSIRKQKTGFMNKQNPTLTATKRSRREKKRSTELCTDSRL